MCNYISDVKVTRHQIITLELIIQDLLKLKFGKIPEKEEAKEFLSEYLVKSYSFLNSDYNDEEILDLLEDSVKFGFNKLQKKIIE